MAGSTPPRRATTRAVSSLLFNRRQVRIGYRRTLRMEQERVPFADGAYLVASQRVTVQARDTEGAVVGRNIDVS